VLAALATYELLRIIAERWPGTTTRGYAGLIVGAAAIALILRGAHPAFPNHPDEDLRPLVGRLLQQRQKGDVILIYPAARHEWFLYSKEPFAIAPREKHPAAFPYTMEARDTVVLDEYPEDSELYTKQIDRAIGANRIWLVASHLGYSKQAGAETQKIETRIRTSGYRLKSKEERSRAFIELWVRSS
jgi:hypothetical protein